MAGTKKNRYCGNIEASSEAFIFAGKTQKKALSFLFLKMLSFPININIFLKKGKLR